MRRLTAALLAASIAALASSTAHAEDGDRLLGADGAVYSVQRGAYKALFPNPPSGWGNNVVLALDIVRGGTLQRVLVPGTDDAEAEHSAALALERTTNNGYIVWAGDGVLNLIGFSVEGWGDILELSGDPSSTKRNPQLTTTVDRYQRIGPDGELVAASRTILHLVWFDQGTAGDRVLYTPLVIEDGNILRANRIFDLAELAGEQESPGDGGPIGVGERPRVRGGNGAVAIGFVPPRSRDLVTVELRSIGGELAFLGDKARAVVIDWGRSNPGLPRQAIADEARAVVIDWGHRLLRPSAADLLAKTFLDHFAASDPAVPIEEAADLARGRMLDEGVALRLGTASQGAPHVLELARGDAVGSTSHLLEVRPPVRRALPESLAAEVPARIVLSPTGTEAALAWDEGDAVRYQETTADGWSEVQSLTLDGALDLDQAFTLLEHRLGRN
jgi:hypothetical protein